MAAYGISTKKVLFIPHGVNIPRSTSPSRRLTAIQPLPDDGALLGAQHVRELLARAGVYSSGLDHVHATFLCGSRPCRLCQPCRQDSCHAMFASAVRGPWSSTKGLLVMYLKRCCVCREVRTVVFRYGLSSILLLSRLRSQIFIWSCEVITHTPEACHHGCRPAQCHTLVKTAHLVQECGRTRSSSCPMAWSIR